MRKLAHLFENNRAWAAELTRGDPDFFERLVGQQSPEYLWIGCSDSRVPANQIVGRSHTGIWSGIGEAGDPATSAIVAFIRRLTSAS